jgi:hypothetical protein
MMDGIDAGGLFRDSIGSLCDDLQSADVPLFVRVPNAVHDMGDNKDLWMPNPAANSSLALSMYAFVGKMIGISIRGSHVLNLNLSSVVWKQLVGKPLVRDDITAINLLCFNVLDRVSSLDKKDVQGTVDPFAGATFCTTTSDGRQLELKKGGAKLKVSWENRHEFIRLEEQYRLNEFNAQVNAIRKGLATIVPVQLLSLFTAGELEFMSCGSGFIDTEYLRANTVYEGTRKTDVQVQMFWRVFDTFTQAQRRKWIRFCYGRSRLAPTAALFTQKFKILSGTKGKVLPTSHTCSFAVHIHTYKDDADMRKYLLYAANNSGSISNS